MNYNKFDACDRQKLREWFLNNHQKETELWILCKRGKMRPEDTLSYLDALEEALCFGWIDSICRAGRDGLCYQRFSPRRARSQWTELNKARVQRLEEQGLMMPAGLKAYQTAQPFEIDSEIQEAFAQNPEAWQNFQQFPELYQRVRIDTIQRYKQNREQFDKRLAKLIAASTENKMFGEWNDDGRLS